VWLADRGGGFKEEEPFSEREKQGEEVARMPVL